MQIYYAKGPEKVRIDIQTIHISLGHANKNYYKNHLTSGKMGIT